MRNVLIVYSVAFLTVGCDAPEDHQELQPTQVHRLINPGEYILVKANVHVCPFFKEYYTDYARVEDSGVTLFGHEIPAADHSSWYVQNELSEAIGKETGRRPETLKIEIVKESEFLARQQEIDADIDLFHKAVAKCEREQQRQAGE